MQRFTRRYKNFLSPTINGSDSGLKDRMGKEMVFEPCTKSVFRWGEAYRARVWSLDASEYSPISVLL